MNFTRILALVILSLSAISSLYGQKKMKFKSIGYKNAIHCDSRCIVCKVEDESKMELLLIKPKNRIVNSGNNAWLKGLMISKHQDSLNGKSEVIFHWKSFKDTTSEDFTFGLGGKIEFDLLENGDYSFKAYQFNYRIEGNEFICAGVFDLKYKPFGQDLHQSFVVNFDKPKFLSHH